MKSCPRVLLTIALPLFLGLPSASEVIGITGRFLLISNNGEYFEKEHRPGMQPGIFFETGGWLALYSEWFIYEKAGKSYVLPIVGLRVDPIQVPYVQPRIAVNALPPSVGLDLLFQWKKLQGSIFLEGYNWGDAGWASNGIRLGFATDFFQNRVRRKRGIEPSHHKGDPP